MPVPFSPPSRLLRPLPFSRRAAQSSLSTSDLPLALDSSSSYTLLTIFWILALVSPLSHLATGTFLLRHLLLLTVPSLHIDASNYVTYSSAHSLTHPWSSALSSLLNRFLETSLNVPWYLNLVSATEVLFYTFQLLKHNTLQNLDPLTMCLKASPMMEEGERWELFERVLDAEEDGVVEFVRGWFFDSPVEDISRSVS